MDEVFEVKPETNVTAEETANVGVHKHRKGNKYLWAGVIAAVATAGAAVIIYGVKKFVDSKKSTKESEETEETLS